MEQEEKAIVLDFSRVHPPQSPVNYVCAFCPATLTETLRRGVMAAAAAPEWRAAADDDDISGGGFLAAAALCLLFALAESSSIIFVGSSNKGGTGAGSDACGVTGRQSKRQKSDEPKKYTILYNISLF